MSDKPFPPGDYQVVVVGTGPGGMQSAYELRRLGVRTAVLSADAGPGGMFRRWPRFHRLNTSSRPYAIVGRDSGDYYRFCWNSLVPDDPSHCSNVAEYMDGTHYFPHRAEMEKALVNFAERSKLEIRYDCRWEATRQEDGRFVLGTTDGEYRCDIAIFATGMSSAWRAPIPGIEEVPHYADLDDHTPESYAGKRVFIIGKRNSAFEVGDALLPWASQLVLGSPHHVRPSVITGIATPPRARYLEVLEDHCFGGGSFVIDVAIERIERTSDGWRVSTQGTTVPGEMVFDVDEVIATTGFETPLGDLRELGVGTFYKDRLPTLTPYWESTTVPGIFFAGAATQGQIGLRKYGFPSASASIGGFRFNAIVQAVYVARKFDIEPERPAIAEDGVVSFLLEQATSSGPLWRQQSHLARILTYGSDGIRDEGVLPLTPFVDTTGPDAVAITVETDPEDNLQPAVYVRRDNHVSEHELSPAFLHDFRTQENMAQLSELVKGLGRS